MDNWILQILLLVASFILGIVVNLITPSIKSYLQKSSLSSRNRKIKEIRDEYKMVREFKNNYLLLIVELIQRIAFGFFEFVAFIVLNSLFIIAVIRSEANKSTITNGYYIFTAIAGFVSLQFLRIPLLIVKVRHFDMFEESRIKKLKKLGATLEEEPELNVNPELGG